MPFYEGLGLVGEKQAVVLEVGHSLTKVGFAGETTPRVVISTPLHLFHLNNDLYDRLVLFIDKLWFEYLLINPKDRRVLLLEDLMAPLHFKRTLSTVLFHHFEVASIYYTSQQLTSLLTLGIGTALVIDAGHVETNVSPVVEGVPLLNALRTAPNAGKALDENVERLMKSRGALVSCDNVIKKLDPSDEAWSQLPRVGEDIKHRLCFVTTRSRGVQLQDLDCDASQVSGLSSFLKRISPSVVYPLSPEALQVTGEVREGAAEVLFVPDDDGKSLAHYILDAIKASPVDCRRELAANLVFIGGTTMMKGYRARVFEELRDLLNRDTHYKASLPNLSEYLALHTPPCRANICGWVGAALLGATDALSAGSFTRDNFVAEKGQVPDWSNFKFNRITASQDSVQGKKG